MCSSIKRNSFEMTHCLRFSTKQIVLLLEGVDLRNAGFCIQYKSINRYVQAYDLKSYIFVLVDLFIKLPVSTSFRKLKVLLHRTRDFLKHME